MNDNKDYLEDTLTPPTKEDVLQEFIELHGKQYKKITRIFFIIITIIFSLIIYGAYSQLTYMNKVRYNQVYESYSGFQTKRGVLSLLNKVTDNLSKKKPKPITIKYNNEITSKEEVEKLINTIKEETLNQYDILLTYDKKGYISLIEILKAD